MEVLGRFIHVVKPSKGSRARPDVIFPRFHQWDAVRLLEADAKEHGAGHNYLVQHSAGSGKSNSIAWLAHRLSSPHDRTDTNVFDKVVVITDRIVLDRQLLLEPHPTSTVSITDPAERDKVIARRWGPSQPPY